VFLFITPYSRRWGKYSLICSLAVLLISRILLYGKDCKRAFAITDTARVPLALCAITCLASIVFSLDPYQSQKIFMSRYVFFFMSAWAGFVLGKDLSRRNIMLLTYVLLVTSAYMSTGGVWDYSRMALAEPRLWTIWGHYTSFNMLPLYLAFFLSFNYAFLLAWGSGFFKWFGLINVFLLIPDIIWQQCRTAYPTVLIGVFFVNFFKNKKFVVACLALLLALIVALSVKSESFRNQVAEYTDMNKWDNRLPLFHSALKMFRARPIAGVGIGMFENLIRTPAYAPPADYMPLYRDFFIHTHNFYLETLAEMGILGIGVFAMLFIIFFRSLIRKIRTTSDAAMRALLTGTGSIIVVYMVFGVALSIITVGLNESSMFWLFFGLTLGLIKREEIHG
jgi:O-antigen ligase